MQIFLRSVVILAVIFLNHRVAAAMEPVDLDPIIITATRIGQHGYKLASNITVIDSDDIAASNAQTIADVLKEAVGAYVYDKNTIKSSVIDMRGFGDTATRNILVLVNDRKINTVDISGPDLLQIPLDMVERIEIIRGAGSVLYGDNAIGGVVNIITKKGKGDVSGKIGGTYGSYSNQSAHVQASGEAKNLSYFIQSKYNDDHGYREHSDVLSKDYNVRLGYDVTEKVSIDLDYGIHEDNYNLPGGLDESELAQSGRRASRDTGNVAQTRDEYIKLGFDIDPWPEDIDFGSFVVDVSYRDRDVFDSFSGFDSDRDIRTKGVTAKYIFNRPLFDRDVNFVTGIDYYDTENDILGSGSNTDDLTISKWEYGLYGFSELELIDQLYMNGGIRYQDAEYVFSQRNVARDERQDPNEVVWMGGFRYEYAQGSNIHVSAQETFRFLATDEWYSSFSGLNTGLQQQTGIQYEAGVKHNFNDKATLHVTPYWIDNKSEIFFDPTAGFFGQNSNYGKTRRVGVEFGGRLALAEIFEMDFLDDFDLFANYTYQRPQFVDGSNDANDIPLVPRHQSTSGVNLQFKEHYYVSLIGSYVGSRYIINDTLNAMPPAKPYYVLDAKLAYKHKNFEIYLAVNNLTDAEYAPYQVKKTASTRDIYPAPERNYLVGVDVKF